MKDKQYISIKFMSNVKIIIENGSLSESAQEALLETFAKRTASITCKSYSANIIVNPILTNYKQVEVLNGDSNRYLIDSFGLIDDEIRIRLATLRLENLSCSILFCFEKIIEPTFNPKNDINEKDGNLYVPDYLEKEILQLTTILKAQQNASVKNFNSFCISGHTGCGKTFLINQVAQRLGSRVWGLTYSDIDAENTELINKKIAKFMGQLKENDFLLIENADTFLCGRDVNRFVKNALISSIYSQKDIFIFFEVSDPSSFENDIKKRLVKYVNIKPLKRDERILYLKLFLQEQGLCFENVKFDNLYCEGFSVKDLKLTSFLTNLYKSDHVELLEALNKAIDEVSESNLNSTISPEAPFHAIRPRYSLQDLILPSDMKDRIRYAAALIHNIPTVYEKWNFKSIDPYPRAVINFHGKPGTGKTMCAHAIAKYLGKDLLALNYAEIESKYIGDAPKKLESAFAYARQHDTVMFFDEADSFLGKRIEDVSHSADQALNSLRSTMLIQLEMFEGVVIFASNLRDNYDKAFKSRFLYEIAFELPDLECRKQLLKKYIDMLPPLSVSNYSEEQIGKLAELSEGLSGREIKNVVLECLNQAAFNNLPKRDSNDMLKIEFKEIEECFVHRVNDLKFDIKVDTNIQEDKKMIGEKLAQEYKVHNEESDHNVNVRYETLLTLAYLAAWSDGTLDVKELREIQNVEKELNINSTSKYSINDNLPSLDDVAKKIQEFDLEKEAIELCCRILAADGEYSQEEVHFVHTLSSLLNLPNNTIKIIDELINIIAEEERLLNQIEIVK